MPDTKTRQVGCKVRVVQAVGWATLPNKERKLVAYGGIHPTGQFEDFPEMIAYEVLSTQARRAYDAEVRSRDIVDFNIFTLDKLTGEITNCVTWSTPVGPQLLQVIANHNTEKI